MGFLMSDYFVSWEIEISANSPRQAAELALAIQRDPTSRSTVFKVYNEDTGYHQEDLECGLV